MTRTRRLIAVLSTMIAAMTVPAAANALTLPGPSAGSGGGQAPAGFVVAHTTSSGVAVWAVVLVAIAAVALGAAIAEGTRALRRRSAAGGFATA
jgi:hypothetical protein